MELHLITEDAFHTAYLLKEWCGAGHDNRGQIVVRAEKPENLADRIAFHQQHVGKTDLSPEEMATLEGLYSGRLSDSEKAMIARYGIPLIPAAYATEKTQWVGENLNEGKAEAWLQEATGKHKNPRFFVFLDRILKEPWKAEMEKGHVFNAHSARLPYAAGMYAVENVAAMNDPKLLNLAAGATVHYVNAGVDEGDIVQVKGFTKPLEQFNSLWELKGGSYNLAFSMLTDLASSFIEREDGYRPEGRKQDLRLRIADHFRAKDFTENKRAQAVQNYNAMKQQRGQNSPGY